MNARELQVYLWTSSTKAGLAPPEREKFHLPGQHDQQDHAGGGPSADGAGRGTVISARPKDLTPDEVSGIRGSIDKWRNADGKALAGEAFESYLSYHGDDVELITADDAKGNTTGLTVLTSISDNGKPYVYVEYLASGYKGQNIGTKLMEKIFERAASKNAGVALYSLHNARGFYRAMGGRLRPNTYNNFVWSAKKVKSMIEDSTDAV